MAGRPWITPATPTSQAARFRFTPAFARLMTTILSSPCTARTRRAKKPPFRRQFIRGRSSSSNQERLRRNKGSQHGKGRKTDSRGISRCDAAARVSRRGEGDRVLQEGVRRGEPKRKQGR